MLIGSLNWLTLPPILKSVNFSGEGLEFLVKSKNAARPIITIARIPITRVPTPPTELVIDSRKLSAGLAFTSISILVVLNSPSSSVTVSVIVHDPAGRSVIRYSSP